MTHYIRYFFVTLSFFLSINAYAVDHVICQLTNSGIPAQVQAGQTYSNVYTCSNTYPASFPAIQLAGSVVGQSAGTSVTGSCMTQKLASGSSCQFKLTVTPGSGTQRFRLQVSVGSLYYINLPEITTSLPLNTISWPGYNSGTAQADSTENGFGSFIANASDSSGHAITYLFEIISGPGTVNGAQTGSFSLTRVNATTVVRITATADDAAPVVGTPITVQISTIPTKVLSFHNNTNETIYPVIEAPILPTDPWMQGLFEITNANIGTDIFQATKLHRVYVNGVAGIPPMQTALVSVPFYSNLVPAPSGGAVADQYVDWWSSMRVYIYDVQSNLINTQSEAGVAPVTLYTPGPTCISGCSQTSVFEATGIMPTNDPQQLTEYTFAAVTTGGPIPYPTNLTIVNYDYSAVDQVYLPVAMEPYGSNLVGYTGTVMNLTTFRNNLTAFINDTGPWPVYSGLPYPRVPGAYNVAVGNPQLTDTTDQMAAFTANWTDCVGNMLHPNYFNCIEVRTLFLNNYTTDCGLSGSPSTATLLEHIYGYASFCATPLPPSGASFNSYKDLQYNFLGYAQDFNPYTQLIHQTLQMNVYAYSVDDLVAFIRAIGNGLVITVGGASGLGNPQQYDKQSVITVSPGSLGSGPFFNYYGICSPTASSGQLGRGEAFTIQLPNSSYPCQITLEDSNNILYHFTLNSPAPLTSTAADISCAPGDSWCAGVLVTSFQGVNTPSPNP